MSMEVIGVITLLAMLLYALRNCMNHTRTADRHAVDARQSVAGSGQLMSPLPVATASIGHAGLERIQSDDCHFCHINMEQVLWRTWPPTPTMLREARPAGNQCYVGTVWDSTHKDWTACCNCCKDPNQLTALCNQPNRLSHLKPWSQNKYIDEACLNCKQRSMDM